MKKITQTIKNNTVTYSFRNRQEYEMLRKAARFLFRNRDIVGTDSFNLSLLSMGVMDYFKLGGRVGEKYIIVDPKNGCKIESVNSRPSSRYDKHLILQGTGGVIPNTRFKIGDYNFIVAGKPDISGCILGNISGLENFA